MVIREAWETAARRTRPAIHRPAALPSSRWSSLLIPLFTADDVVLLTEANTHTFDRWCDLGAIAGRIATLLPKRDFRRAIARMVNRMVETEQYGVLVEALDALEAHGDPAVLATLRPSDLLPALIVGGYHHFVRERAMCFLQHVGAAVPNT